MAWSFVLTTLAGQPIGELRQNSSRGFRRSLNRGRTIRGSIRANNSLAAYVQQNERTLVKAYDDRSGAKVLRHCGPITGHEKTVDERGRGAIGWNAAGPEWRLLSRLIGKNAGGAVFGGPVTLVDRGSVMSQIITALNGGSAPLGTSVGDTGIRPGVIVPSGSSYFGPWRWYPASSAFADLSSGLDGPDYDFAPVEPVVDAYGLQIAALNVAPAIGQLRANAVFEFGDGKRNVKGFSIVSDSGVVANDVAHLPPGFPDNATQAVIEQSDAQSIIDRGLREDVLTEDVTTDALRLQLVQDHIAVRKQQRRTITFSPVRDPDPFGTPLEERRVPRPFVDYDVGDIVPFRATELVDVVDPTSGLVTGCTAVKTVDAFFRVFTIDIDIGDDGSETPTLTFVEEGR